MKKSLLIFIFIIAASIAHAEDLSNFPDMFISNGDFNANIVVGNKAPASYVIAQGKLVSFFGQMSETPMIGKTKLATDLDSLDQNLIMIGSPCTNELADFLTNYPLECSWIDGKPGIHYVDYKGYNHIIISGDDSDIKQGVDILINYKAHDMIGPQIFLQESEKPVLKENIDDELNKTAVMDELSRKIAQKTSEEKKPEPNISIVEEPAVIKEPLKPEPEKIEIKTEEKGFFARILKWFRSIFD